MADDYLSDHEQEEAVRAWWRENWRWILGGVALGLAILGGWRWWGDYQLQQANQASKLYADVRTAVDGKNLEQAERLMADLTSAHGGSGYAQQARLLIASQHVEDGKPDEALTLLRAVVEEADDEELAQIAGLRAARVLIDQGKHDEALAMLDTEQAGAFSAQVREIRGDALAAKGDADGARAEYAAALAANADAQIDRTLLEMKLQDVGGDVAVAAQGAP